MSADGEWKIVKKIHTHNDWALAVHWLGPSAPFDSPALLSSGIDARPHLHVLKDAETFDFETTRFDKQNTEWIRSVRANQDASRVVSVDDHGAAVIWTLASAKPLLMGERTGLFAGYTYCVTFGDHAGMSPEVFFVAGDPLGDTPGGFKMLDCRQPGVVKTFVTGDDNDTKKGTHVQLHSDGTRLFTTNLDNQWGVFDVRTGAVLHKNGGNSGSSSAYGLALVPANASHCDNADTALIVGASGVEKWEVGSDNLPGTVTLISEDPSTLRAIDVSSHGDFAAILGGSRTLTIFEPSTGTKTQEIEVCGSGGKAVSIRYDDCWMATASDDQRVTILNRPYAGAFTKSASKR